MSDVPFPEHHNRSVVYSNSRPHEIIHPFQGTCHYVPKWPIVSPQALVRSRACRPLSGTFSICSTDPDHGRLNHPVAAMHLTSQSGSALANGSRNFMVVLSSSFTEQTGLSELPFIRGNDGGVYCH
ncbi:unnamed protein product [Orchesella dallaii]|uniref:Uncharacterized protein n=1 Tax=Orchesella dallaii TaxID=48710 RepID=A0ABP1RJA2_9HEXA